jgi:hypothetical protein
MLDTPARVGRFSLTSKAEIAIPSIKDVQPARTWFTWTNSSSSMTQITMASQKKSHVFRVTGLSRDQPDWELETGLQEALNENFTAGERSQIKAEITVVPSCYESDTQRVALVQFRGGMPQFLAELTTNTLGDWQIEMGDEDINFDSHFFGFTQLYAPDENETVVAE